MIIEKTTSGYTASQTHHPKNGVEVYFFSDGKTITEALIGIVGQVAKYCTQTGEHPSNIIDSKTYTNTAGANHAA